MGIVISRSAATRNPGYDQKMRHIQPGSLTPFGMTTTRGAGAQRPIPGSRFTSHSSISNSHSLISVLDLAVPQALHLFTRRQQFVQLAFGFDAPILQHHDMVGPAQSGLTV